MTVTNSHKFINLPLFSHQVMTVVKSHNSQTCDSDKAVTNLSLMTILGHFWRQWQSPIMTVFYCHKKNCHNVIYDSKKQSQKGFMTVFDSHKSLNLV